MAPNNNNNTNGDQGSEETISYQAFDSWKNLSQKKYEAIKRYFAEADHQDILKYLIHLMLHEVIKIDVNNQGEPRFKIILRRWENNNIVKEEDITNIVRDAFMRSNLSVRELKMIKGVKLSDEDIRMIQFPLLLTILSEWAADRDVGLPLSFQELKERAAIEEATSYRKQEHKIHHNYEVFRFLYHIDKLMAELLPRLIMMQKGNNSTAEMDDSRIISSIVSQLNSSFGPKMIRDALMEETIEEGGMVKREESEKEEEIQKEKEVEIKVEGEESEKEKRKEGEGKVIEQIYTEIKSKPVTARTKGGGDDDGRKPPSTTGMDGGDDDEDKDKDKEKKKETTKPDLVVHKEDFNFVENLVKKVDVPTKPIFHTLTKELAWDLRVKLELGRRLFPSLMFYFQDLIKPDEFLDPEKLGSRLASEMVAIVDYYQKSGINIHELINKMENLKKENEEYKRSYRNLIFAINQLRSTLIPCPSCGNHIPVGPNIVGTLITILATRKFAYDILQGSTETRVDSNNNNNSNNTNE
jgi:hypothetical protein